MKACLGSSAFAKRFVNEEGREVVEAIGAQADSLGLSVICVPEIVWALHVACALEWAADVFAAADTRQLTAARRAGLKAKQTRAANHTIQLYLVPAGHSDAHGGRRRGLGPTRRRAVRLGMEELQNERERGTTEVHA